MSLGVRSLGISALLLLSPVGCGGAERNAQPAHPIQGQSRALSTRPISTTTTPVFSTPRRGSNQDRASYAEGFVQGCEGSCTQGAALCSAYCSCMSARVLRDGQGPHLDELALQGEAALMRDPWFLQAFAACGADIHDVSFMQGCTQSCPNCGAFCQCAIDHIRAGMTREEGTRFFLEHIDSGVTETGQVAMNGAIQACMPLRPAQ